MKRILIVEELYHPFIGGIQIRTQNFAEHWASQGIEVTVAAIDHTGILPMQEILNGVKIERLHCDRHYYKNGFFGRKISTIFLYTYKLFRFIKKKEFDAIIFNQFPILPLLAYPVFFGKKTVTVIDFVEYRHDIFWGFIQKWMLISADKVVSINDYNCHKILQHNSDCLVIFNSFDPNKYLVKDHTEDYIFIGRIETHKHLEDAIGAVILLENRKKLHIVGEGSQYEYLKNKYQSEQFIFHGFLKEHEKNELLSSCRVLILPSEREGTSGVMIEAMMCNIPTVTTNYINNGNRHFVSSNKNGLVAEPDIIAIKNRILDIEENYAEFRGHCNSAKQHYNLFENSQKFLDYVFA